MHSRPQLQASPAATNPIQGSPSASASNNTSSTATTSSSSTSFYHQSNTTPQTQQATQTALANHANAVTATATPTLTSPPPNPRRASSLVGLTVVKPLMRMNAGSIASSHHHHKTDQEDISFTTDPHDYEIGPVIGYGSSAVVHLSKYRPLNKQIALKIIDLDKFERNQIDELRRETQVMQLCKHPNLLRVYSAFVKDSSLCVVTPFASAGSCLDIMRYAHQEGLREVTIATILHQALQGLEYLHKNGHIHRDVKAGNLLVDQDGSVMLADFGVAATLNNEGANLRRTFVGTPCWMAPEVMEQSGYDQKADIWSFGITALELANGHAPLARYPPIKVLMLTLSNEPPTLDRENTHHKYTKGFKELIDMSLQKDPTRRPGCEKLLQHSFFRQAKKKNYLVQNLLVNLPPLIQRMPRKNGQQAGAEDKLKLEDAPKGVSWDFSGQRGHSQEAVKDIPSSREDQTVSTDDRVSSTTPVANEKNDGARPDETGSQPLHTPPRRMRVNFNDESLPLLPESPSQRLYQKAQQAQSLPRAHKGRFIVEQDQSPAHPSPSDSVEDMLRSASVPRPAKSLPAQEPMGSETSSTRSPSVSTLERKGRFDISTSGCGCEGGVAMAVVNSPVTGGAHPDSNFGGVPRPSRSSSPTTTSSGASNPAFHAPGLGNEPEDQQGRFCIKTSATPTVTRSQLPVSASGPACQPSVASSRTPAQVQIPPATTGGAIYSAPAQRTSRFEVTVSKNGDESTASLEIPPLQHPHRVSTTTLPALCFSDGGMSAHRGHASQSQSFRTQTAAVTLGGRETTTSSVVGSPVSAGMRRGRFEVSSISKLSNTPGSAMDEDSRRSNVQASASQSPTALKYSPKAPVATISNVLENPTAPPTVGTISALASTMDVMVETMERLQLQLEALDKRVASHGQMLQRILDRVGSGSPSRDETPYASSQPSPKPPPPPSAS